MTVIMEAVKKQEKAILQTYDYLHSIPEWGYEEVKTSAYVEKTLQEHGINVKRVTETGLVAEIDSGVPGPCIGLRADMDALPFTNEQGETYYCHACGHDSHMTMGIWTLLQLKELGLVKKGKIRGIFQPAEERLTGAKSMIKAGAAKGMDEFYGVHIRPIQEIPYGKAAPALWHGASVMAEIVVHGQTAHGARPHLGANAIDAAALVIAAVNSIWLNPSDTWSAKVTRIHSGGSMVNIIPNKAVLSLDVRAARNDLMKEMVAKLEMACQAATAVGCSAELKLGDAVPAAEYDQSCIDALGAAISHVLGQENCVPPLVTPGSDDFHEYKVADPALKTAFLALGSDAAPGLHNPAMHFKTEAMFTGVAILTEALASRVR